MKMKTLRDLFLDQMRDAYSAEKQLVKALPKMAEAAAAPELKAGFEKHLGQTETHVRRLETVFEAFGARARSKTCEAMQGLIEEGKDLIDEGPEADVLDAGLICAAQKVEHYEIAAYGTLCTWARQLGHDREADLLHQTLDEEKETDETLTRLATAGINQMAMQTA
jgi:ferritin-like metal-binding protein YciE